MFIRRNLRQVRVATLDEALQRTTQETAPHGVRAEQMHGGDTGDHRTAPPRPEAQSGKQINDRDRKAKYRQHRHNRQHRPWIQAVEGVNDHAPFKVRIKNNQTHGDRDQDQP